MPVVATPELGPELGVGTGFLFMASLFTVPAILGMVIEPVVLAWSDALDRRRVLLLSLLGMALSLGLCALAPNVLWLSVAFGVWGVFTGIAAGVAQGALVLRSAEPERDLTRWTLSAELGDLAAPALIALVAAAGLGWRAALGVSAGLAMGVALAVWRAPLEEGEDEDDEDEALEPLGEALRAALRDRELLGWLAAVASCTLMDEIILVLMAVRVDDQGAVGEAQIFAVILGGVLGLGVAERVMHRLSSRALLLGSAALSALSLVGWLQVESLPAALALVFLLGAGIALQYPLAKARCYAAIPGRPGLVNALDRVFGATELVAPLAIGAVASRWGTEAALLCLLLQPLLIGLAAWRSRSAPRP